LKAQNQGLCWVGVLRANWNERRLACTEQQTLENMWRLVTEIVPCLQSTAGKGKQVDGDKDRNPVRQQSPADYEHTWMPAWDAWQVRFSVLSDDSSWLHHRKSSCINESPASWMHSFLSSEQ